MIVLFLAVAAITVDLVISQLVSWDNLFYGFLLLFLISVVYDLKLQTIPVWSDEWIGARVFSFVLAAIQIGHDRLKDLIINNHTKRISSILGQFLSVTDSLAVNFLTLVPGAGASEQFPSPIEITLFNAVVIVLACVVIFLIVLAILYVFNIGGFRDSWCPGRNQVGNNAADIELQAYGAVPPPGHQRLAGGQAVRRQQSPLQRF
ncbi:hypothetical protein CAEBREN_15843 [Caenorhabditis brenneri]|uniref:Uncharacterized protein n=1 Tax=Caenorhabditis brenneri TaxID=135651 RepID=G0N195_CAEBE|nr:hypothetical protein CAEBREN_15843 [Caenorhabditis brenneri]